MEVKTSKLAIVFYFLGSITILLGLYFSLSAPQYLDPAMKLIYFVSGCVSGILLIGVGKIINLLLNINIRLHAANDILLNENELKITQQQLIKKIIK